MKKFWLLATAGAVAALFSGIAISAVADSSPGSPKDQLAQRHAADRAAAVAGPRAAKDGVHPPLTTERLTVQVGVIQTREGPVPTSQFVVSNAWAGRVPGSVAAYYVVWAGAGGSASGAAHRPGITVHVQTLTADGSSLVDSNVGTFFQSQATGPLSIVNGAAYSISLRTADGQVFGFDLRHDLFT
jgi:hypothetical protein